MGRGAFSEEIPFQRERLMYLSHRGPVPARKSVCLMHDVQGAEETCFVTNESLDPLKSPFRCVFAEVEASTNWVSLKQGFFFLHFYWFLK